MALLLLIQLSFAGTLKVTTYNIRYDNPADGVNQWSNRKTTLIDLIKTNDADILCIQEGLVNQITDLQIALPNYQYVGVGRDDGQRKGEYAAIFYKKEKFQLLQNKHFWLSETPEIAGSIGWDAACVRICTWAQLYSIQDSQSLYVFNTHMDHVGAQARKNSAALLLKRISDLPNNTPTLLCGDFNSEPSDTAYQLIVENKKTAFSDSYQTTTARNCTFTGFEVNSAVCKRIDYLFYNNRFKVESYQVLSSNNGKYYPSDHLVVSSVFSWKK